MVKAPVVITLAPVLPEIEPIIPLAMMAVLAGPPVILPVTAYAKVLKNSPAPETSKKAPKRTNKKTNVDETPIGILKIPSILMYSVLMILLSLNPACPSKSGNGK